MWPFPASCECGVGLAVRHLFNQQSKSVGICQTRQYPALHNRQRSRPYFTEEADNPIDKARFVSAQQLPSSEVLLPPMEGLDDLREIIYEELQLAMLGSKSVDDAVTAAADRWNRLV